MELHTFVRGKFEEGITTAESDKLGRGIRVGVRGRGRYDDFVKLDARRPAEVIQDRVFRADLIRFTVGERIYYALSNESGESASSTSVLLRANTAGPYTRGSGGRIDPYWGEPLKVSLGWDAWGDAGRIGTLPDALYVLRNNEALYVLQAGGYKGVGGRVVLNEDGVLESYEMEVFWQEKLPELVRTCPEWAARVVESSPYFRLQCEVRAILGGVKEETVT